jgi:hypothetical protein
MKRKLVLWGNNAQDEKVLIGLELVADQKEVNIYTLLEDQVTEELNKQLFNEWRDQNQIGFPVDDVNKIVRELTVSDTILPEDLKTTETELIHRAQTEWHFVVLSTKLSQTYEQELEDYKDRIDRLNDYDPGIWEELKTFWSKVQSQIREKNLFREHSIQLKKITNELFDQMKALRKKRDQEFRELSDKRKADFLDRLKAYEEKIEKGIRLQGIFNELKELQREFKSTDLVRRDRNELWSLIDGLFKKVKEKRFGDSDSQKKGRSQIERLESRYDGLMKAIQRMEHSISKDEKELNYQKNKRKGFAGQLEQQLQEAKMKMIQERIDSKKEKHEDMLKTKIMLEKRMEGQREKDRIQKIKQEAKKEAEAKIKQEIQQQEKELEQDEDKLKKAALKIKQPKKKSIPQKDNPKTEEAFDLADFSAHFHGILQEEE